MSQQTSSIRKPQVCNRCFSSVNWDNNKRTAMNTKRPLTEDGTAIHECPKDGAGNIVINQENQKLYQEWEASKNASASASAGQQGTLSQNDVTNIMAVMMDKLREMSESIKTQEQNIARMEGVLEGLARVLQDYVTNDPVGTQLNRLIETMLKYLPEPETGFQSAADLKGVGK